MEVAAILQRFLPPEERDRDLQPRRGEGPLAQSHAVGGLDECMARVARYPILEGPRFILFNAQGSVDVRNV